MDTSSKKSNISALFIAMLFCLIPATGWADTANALKFYEQAKQAYGAGNYREAADLLERAYAEARGILDGVPDLPETGLAAEHYCDNVFWQLFQDGEALPYPGGKAALVEFHYEVWPQRVEEVFFEMQVKGVRPVLAHPERYLFFRDNF